MGYLLYYKSIVLKLLEKLNASMLLFDVHLNKSFVNLSLEGFIAFARRHYTQQNTECRTSIINLPIKKQWLAIIYVFQ